VRKTTAIGGVLLAVALLLSACNISSQPPKGPVVWVANKASVTYPGSRITPVNMTTQKSEATVLVGSLPSALAFTKGGTGLLVTTQGDDMLHEVDPTTRTVVHTVGVGVEPDAVAVAPGGTGGAGIALVANLDANSVTPVDLGTWKAGPAIAVGTQPVAIGVAVTGATTATAFVVDFGSNQVTPIALPTMTAGAPIAVGPSPQAIGMAPGVALVGNFGNHTLTPINTATLAPGTAVALPADPTGIAVTSSGTTAYIAGGDSVTPLAVTGLTLGAPITLPDVAQAIALTPQDTTAWVALQAGSVVEVNVATGAVGRPVHLRGHPSALAIDPQ
jgi:hyaluronoglucosaminidase